MYQTASNTICPPVVTHDLGPKSRPSLELPYSKTPHPPAQWVAGMPGTCMPPWLLPATWALSRLSCWTAARYGSCCDHHRCTFLCTGPQYHVNMMVYSRHGVGGFFAWSERIPTHDDSKARQGMLHACMRAHATKRIRGGFENVVNKEIK